MNISRTKCLVRILSAGAMALSVARISADIMKFGLVYEYKRDLLSDQNPAFWYHGAVARI